MISYEDPKWQELYGGYHALYDPSIVLRALESGGRPKKEVWNELFQELHHQGEIDTASYAAVPEITRITKQKGLLDWEPFALVACIEDCRHSGNNCALPTWLEESYLLAIRDLARYGCSLSERPWSPELAKSIMAIVAFANGLPVHGTLLSSFTDDELEEMIGQYRNAE